MAKIVVAGLINIETTLQVEGFPIYYDPVRYPFYGVNSTVSGVGYNIAKALTILGDDITFLSMVGKDLAGKLVSETLEEENIPALNVLSVLDKTPQSVILYEKGGRRQIHVDLKDIQERAYPPETLPSFFHPEELAVLCNINFARPLLGLAKKAGACIATDVHAIGSLEDEYNQDFMAHADILFMSDERIPHPPEEWAEKTLQRFGNQILVIGLGAEGALLAVRGDGYIGRIPAVTTRPVVNTIGAGDALFSAFLHFYRKTNDPYLSIRKAVVYASYKIGASGAAEGFLKEIELDRLVQ